VLAKGCAVAVTPADCLFCVVAGNNSRFDFERCRTCPLLAKKGGECGGYWSELDGVLRRAIFRHVLKNVSDFTDVSEIRERIAEMLDDPEKFLGKAERKPKYLPEYDNEGNGAKLPGMEFRFYIGPNPWECEGIIAAFRDEETRDFCLEKLKERK